jgi:hypothetical protein
LLELDGSTLAERVLIFQQSPFHHSFEAPPDDCFIGTGQFRTSLHYVQTTEEVMLNTAKNSEYSLPCNAGLRICANLPTAQTPARRRNDGMGLHWVICSFSWELTQFVDSIVPLHTCFTNFVYLDELQLLLIVQNNLLTWFTDYLFAHQLNYYVAPIGEHTIHDQNIVYIHDALLDALYNQLATFFYISNIDLPSILIFHLTTFIQLYICICSIITVSNHPMNISISSCNFQQAS